MLSLNCTIYIDFNISTGTNRNLFSPFQKGVILHKVMFIPTFTKSVRHGQTRSISYKNPLWAQLIHERIQADVLKVVLLILIANKSNNENPVDMYELCQNKMPPAIFKMKMLLWFSLW